MASSGGRDQRRCCRAAKATAPVPKRNNVAGSGTGRHEMRNDIRKTVELDDSAPSSAENKPLMSMEIPTSHGHRQDPFAEFKPMRSWALNPCVP
jgi:hypothetical protein